MPLTPFPVRAESASLTRRCVFRPPGLPPAVVVVSSQSLRPLRNAGTCGVSACELWLHRRQHISRIHVEYRAVNRRTIGDGACLESRDAAAKWSGLHSSRKVRRRAPFVCIIWEHPLFRAESYRAGGGPEGDISGAVVPRSARRRTGGGRAGKPTKDHGSACLRGRLLFSIGGRRPPGDRSAIKRGDRVKESVERKADHKEQARVAGYRELGLGTVE